MGLKERLRRDRRLLFRHCTCSGHRGVNHTQESSSRGSYEIFLVVRTCASILGPYSEGTRQHCESAIRSDGVGSAVFDGTDPTSLSPSFVVVTEQQADELGVCG